ncbi:DUF6919 domain-containing protein [Streptomyces sp. NPDC003011]
MTGTLKRYGREAARQLRDARTWYAARTFDDLAALTADWMKGELVRHPNGHHTGPDLETRPLLGALEAANRGGFLTDGSQPGELETFLGRPWRQRAFVSGFVADPLRAGALAAQAADAGLLVRAYPPRIRHKDAEPGSVDVTTWGDSVNTDCGGHLLPREIWRIFLYCHPHAVRAVVDAWQITLVDPQWGRNTLLWPLLNRL